MTPGTTGTTTRTTETTTERRRFGHLSQVSVRTRITVVIALLTAAAMTGAGLLVYALESARIERAVNDQIDQEIAEFRELKIDPLTGKPFDNVGSLLDVFLTRNVPDDDEMLVGYAAGAPPARTRNRYGQEVLDEPAYQRAVADSSESGGTTVITSQRFGEVWVTVVPVRNSGSKGSLVIVNFLADEHTELNRTLRTYALVALMSLGLISTIAAFQSGRLLAPLRTLEETARDITTTDLSRRIPEQGNDDITALTRTINLMLERLDAGFTDQRRFLDDAGHELRTPLTVMRGHLELLDHGDPAEIAETRDLLLDEVDRMSRLVGDLIVLAKTRRPDFLTVEAVDLAPFTHVLLAKARGLGDRDWQLDATAEGAFTVDEQRITQAVLQLADNAVKHTDPGDTIAIGSSINGGTATIWVRDTGHGVPVAQREAIFERFSRGSVRPGDEGFGLGLSIVRAIAHAHGGTVSVTDAQPSGARFDLTLPTEEVPAPWPRS
jgi:two-component system OmpR family sensor kinase